MGSIYQIVLRLSPALPYVLFAIILFILSILTVLFLIFRSAKKKAQPDESGEDITQAADDDRKAIPPPIAPVSILGLRKSFSRAMKVLRSNVSGRNYRYQIPWILMLGPAGSGKTTALDMSGCNLPFGKPIEKGPEVKEGCNWWFFEKGIILDIAGDLVLRDDGKTHNERGWRLLLRLLQKHRPERPIDGVVLTIPCMDLLGPNAQGGPDLNKAAEKADLLYRRLWHAQKVLGIRFPVYVLITKCDHIEGFQSFCRAIPKRLGNNMFGWSSPYGIDAGFSSEWVYEAFQSIHRELSRTQYELFTEGTDLEESDGLFVFPHNFQPLSEPIQVYLDRLFKSSVYHESFIFRGIYFCGDSGTEQAETTSIMPMFLKDLFEKKLFPESGLARPATRTVISRNRKVLAAQAVAAVIVLVGGLGLWWSYSQLQLDKGALQPVLEQIAEDVQHLRSLEYREHDGLMLYSLLREPSVRIPFEQSAMNLFEGMTKIRSLTSVFIPSSWFSDIHEEIQKSMVLAYDEIILKTMYTQLLQKAKEIFEVVDRPSPAGVKNAKILPVEEIPEFIELRMFVENLRELEKYVDLYNGLRTTRDLTDLGHLAKYLFGIELPEGFYKNAKYYHHALGRTKYRVFDPSIFRIKARFFTLRKLTDRLYERLFQSNVISAYLDVLSLQLKEFGQTSRSSTRDGAMIQDLLDTIGQTEKTLAKPELAWVSHEKLNLGESFDSILSKVEVSNFLGRDMRMEVQRAGEDAFRKFKDELKEKRTPLTGPLLRREGGEILAMLSQGVLNLKADLEKLLSQEFMTLEPSKGRTFEVPPGTRLVWGIPMLQKAVTLIEPYEEFIREGLGNFPTGLQNTIRSMAQSSLEGQILNLVGRAQRFKPISDRLSTHPRETAIRSEVKNFNEAAKLLDRLLTTLDELDLVAPFLDLSELVYWQTSTLLEAIDGVLSQEGIYRPKGQDFSWWNGVKPLPLVAFDLSSEDELRYYVELQRERVKQLAYAYAEPIVTFFMNRPTPRDPHFARLLAKWENILLELDKYERKQPGNSVTALEKFILFEMDAITKENYEEKITRKELSERSGDFFLQTRNNLRRLLFEQCEVLATTEALGEYREIREFFNQKLVGRFPFCAIEAGEILSEVDPEDIQDFYRIFDKDEPAIRKVVSGNDRFGISGEKALEFLNEMETVRLFFAPFLEGDDKDKPEVPAFDFMVTFRVNQDREVEGNQIIEWMLTVGEQEFQYQGERHRGRWHFGDPVQLSLRWAKNSTAFPVPPTGRPEIKVSGKKVVFRYGNLWSFLYLLRNHSASPGDFDQLADPKPHTLKFEIDISHPDGTKQAGETARARVFIRVTPMAPDEKKRQVLIMPSFPSETAPALKLKSMGRKNA
jgi:type VI secretion system protein ImpL